MNKVNTLLNSTTSRDDSYELFVDIKESSLSEYVDIRFYSKFSAAKDKNAEQTKWQTTFPIEALETLNDSIIEYLRENIKSKL
jgi:hypothetical protein